MGKESKEEIEARIEFLRKRKNPSDEDLEHIDDLYDQINEEDE